MNASSLERNLIEWSVLNSGYDEHRNYIGLSGIGDCSLVIYRKYFNRTGASAESQLKTRYAYEVEQLIQKRLLDMGRSIKGYLPGKEISLYDGLVQGHTDGEFDEDLLEIKTVPLFEHIPADGRIPWRPFWQSQAYMLYGNYERSLIIYFGRDYGIFKVFELWRDRRMGDRIMSKVDALVEFVRTKIPPPCDCGKCK